MLAFGLTALQADDVDKGIEAANNNDMKTAEIFFNKACTSGEATGCYNLGLMYDKGEGVRQSYPKAKELYGKACDGGYASGCYNLGLMYHAGEGVRQSYAKAKELFGKACDGGHAGGCKNYAILNKQGH